MASNRQFMLKWITRTLDKYEIVHKLKEQQNSDVSTTLNTSINNLSICIYVNTKKLNNILADDFLIYFGLVGRGLLPKLSIV